MAQRLAPKSNVKVQVAPRLCIHFDTWSAGPTENDLQLYLLTAKRLREIDGRFVLSAARDVGTSYFDDPRVVSDHWLVRFPACK